MDEETSPPSTSRTDSPTDDVENVSKFIEEETLKPCIEDAATDAEKECAENSESADIKPKIAVKPAHVALGIKDFVKDVVIEEPGAKEGETLISM